MCSMEGSSRLLTRIRDSPCSEAVLARDAGWMPGVTNSSSESQIRVIKSTLTRPIRLRDVFFQVPPFPILRVSNEAHGQYRDYCFHQALVCHCDAYLTPVTLFALHECRVKPDMRKVNECTVHNCFAFHIKGERQEEWNIYLLGRLTLSGFRCAWAVYVCAFTRKRQGFPKKIILPISFLPPLPSCAEECKHTPCTDSKHYVENACILIIPLPPNNRHHRV